MTVRELIAELRDIEDQGLPVIVDSYDETTDRCKDYEVRRCDQEKRSDGTEAVRILY